MNGWYWTGERLRFTTFVGIFPHGRGRPDLGEYLKIETVRLFGDTLLAPLSARRFPTTGKRSTGYHGPRPRPSRSKGDSPIGSPAAFGLPLRKDQATSRVRYPFQMLKKVRETQPLKFLTKEQRWNTLQDVYQVVDGFTRRRFRTCWFVDDITTTGATARTVWKALLRHYPDIDFRVYALARTVYDPQYNSDLSADETYESRWQSYFPVAEEPVEGYGDKVLDFRDLPMPDFSNENTFFL